jgi:hypothetical protein
MSEIFSKTGGAMPMKKPFTIPYKGNVEFRNALPHFEQQRKPLFFPWEKQLRGDIMIVFVIVVWPGPSYL